jgi:hypothetical protein
MSLPRVLFVEGDGASPAGLIVPRTPADSAAEAAQGTLARSPHWAMWRLLSGNNRELGRSATTFPLVDDAIAAVIQLRAGWHRLESHDVQETQPSQWSWVVTLDDVAVARSTRRYQRLRECRYSLAGFMEGLPIATVVTDLDRIVRQRRPHLPAVEPAGSPTAVLR